MGRKAVGLAVSHTGPNDIFMFWFGRPVDIPQIQPESELVEREGRAHAVQDRRRRRISAARPVRNALVKNIAQWRSVNQKQSESRPRNRD
jgi:hypothetical protein